MNKIVLNGLTGSNPICAMAAFGLLRLCENIGRFQKAKIGWQLRDDWVAFLELPEKISHDDLAHILAQDHSQRDLSWLNWGNDLRIAPETFKEEAFSLLCEASAEYREPIDFMAAYGSEVFLDGKGKLSPTLFHMTSGQQKFLSSLQEIECSLRAPSKKHSSPEKAFSQALFGPWLYDDAEHSLGWDPSMERMHALRFQEPSKDKNNKSVRAAVWLASMALPLFPASPGVRKLQTGGFQRKGRTQRFRWPLWETAISLPSLKSLLTCGEIYQEGKSCRKKLRARGICAVFECKRHSFGQGYGIFRPAELIF